MMGMNTQAEVPIGDPLRDAWEAYKVTSDFANSRKWAAQDEHVDGSLWASFVVGFNCGRESLTSPATQGAAVAWEMSYPLAMPTIHLISAPEFVRSEVRAQVLADGCAQEYGEAATYRALYTAPAASPRDGVPAWPTRDMQQAGSMEGRWSFAEVTDIYRAMLAAAPSPATEQAGAEGVTPSHVVTPSVEISPAYKDRP